MPIHSQQANKQIQNKNKDQIRNCVSYISCNQVNKGNPIIRIALELRLSSMIVEHTHNS